MDSRILATVGGQNITEADVEGFLVGLGQRGEAYRSPEGRAAVLEELINRRLFLLEATRGLFEAEPAFKAQLKQAKETLLISYAMEKALSSVTVKEEEKVVTETGTTTTTTTATADSEGNTEKTEAKEETVVNEDGTTTTTTTAKTETAHANGSTGTTVEENGKVTAEVTLSEKAVTEAAEAGKAVVLPVPAIQSKNDAAEAPVINVTTAAATETPVTLEIPVAEAKPGTVVVLVHEDGTEEVVPKTAQTEAGLSVQVEGNVTVKVVDNAKEFVDTDNHWAADAIDHASSRELFNGVSEDEFAPNETMNRAMLATVLWRMEGKQEATTESTFDDVQDGHWAEEATHWAAEKGIIEGDGTSFNGDQAVTREQLVTMLYRLSGSPEVSEEDAVDGAAWWAADAVAWAVKIGLMKGDGTGLNLQGPATRAQVATFMMRFTNMGLAR